MINLKQLSIVSIGLVASVSVFAEPAVLNKKMETISGGHWSDKVTLYKALCDQLGAAPIRIFDAIEQEVLLNFKVEKTRKTEMLERDGAMGALACSGDHKYLSTLEKVLAESPDKLARHNARLAISKIPYYAELIPLVISNEYSSSSRTERQAFLLRLLNSSNYSFAAESIKYSINELNFDDEEYNQSVISQLESMYRKNSKSRDVVQFQSWACKFIGLSPQDHTALLKSIFANSPNRTVKKWAKKAIINDYGFR